MAFFEQELARGGVLSLFIPPIVSSGGNFGSKASTPIIRAPWARCGCAIGFA
jgi:Mg/Co/Ni transporter MgtE